MSEDEDGGERLPSLGTTGRDRIVAGARALAGVAPGIGSILSEVIGQLIPDQRQERLEAYVRILDERLQPLEQEALDKKLRKPEKIDLFEEGAFQAARSLSPERTEYIASTVFIGIAGEQKEEIEAKRLLKILAELEDDQIIILASHLEKNRTEEFRGKHADVLEPVGAHMQSSREELDKDTLQEAANLHMTRLGLLRLRFKRPKRGELPEFDERTGMIKARGDDITRLGRLLLRYVGLAGEDDM